MNNADDQGTAARAGAGRRGHPLGRLALHIANIPGAIAEISTRPFDVNTPIPRPEPRSRAEVLEALERSLARAWAVLSEMDDAALELPWRMMDGEREVGSIPRGDLVRSTMLNHWSHHRGQLTVYYRETGTPVPAIYGDSAAGGQAVERHAMLGHLHLREGHRAVRLDRPPGSPATDRVYPFGSGCVPVVVTVT